MAQTPEEMAATMIANLPAKTGKSLEQWLAVVRASGLAKHGQIVKMLKGDHGVTHGFANLIAHEARSAERPQPADPVAAQYAGPKAALEPIYDAVIATVERFGDDVEIAPKKAYVSLRRKKQFALVQPSTRTRVDLGINLRDAPTDDRLEKAGSFNSMVSHRVRLEDPRAVDGEVEGWLRQAYDEAG